jgi:hypothetical protein
MNRNFRNKPKSKTLLYVGGGMFVLAVVAIATYYFYFIKNKETPSLTDEEKLAYREYIQADGVIEGHENVVEKLKDNGITSESDKIKIFLIWHRLSKSEFTDGNGRDIVYRYSKLGDEVLLKLELELEFPLELGSNLFKYVKKGFDDELMKRLNNAIDSGALLCDATTYKCVLNPDFVDDEEEV